MLDKNMLGCSIGVRSIGYVGGHIGGGGGVGGVWGSYIL